jgi:preprotein translocase subunit SecG
VIILLIVLHVIFCLTLILVILLQAGRGQGLTGPAFGTGNVQTLFGTRASDFLSRATSVAAIAFLLTSIGLDYYEAKKSRSLLEVKQKAAHLDLAQVQKALEEVKKKEAETKVQEPQTPSPAEPKAEPPTSAKPE